MNAPLWGEETAKALANFGGGGTPEELIRAYAEVKLAALEGIQETEAFFSLDTMEALREAAGEIIRGKWTEAFPLSLAQGGAGTSLHMNICEVLSSLCSRRIGRTPDPIEHLARYQSTNDTFATAVVIVAYRRVERLEALVVALQEKLVSLELEYDNILFTGRTELQDALPMRAGSLFGSWAGAVERDRWRLSKVTERVREIPLGGTALGTGFAAPRRYTHAAERHLRRITGLPLCRSQNTVDAVAFKDSLAEVACAVRLSVMNLAKITADLLFYSSSPVGEILHPNLQYGSSMMPLKTNPVLLERCRGLSISVMGEADKLQRFAEEGQLQLNAYLPFICRSLIQAADETEMAQGDLLLFFQNMSVAVERMEQNLCRSAAVLNALLPLLGYRRLKNLSAVIQSNAPQNLGELATLVSGATGIDENTISEYLTPAALAGPPKDQI